MTTLITLDDGHEGLSRLATNLRQRERLFVGEGEPLSRAAYAATVWSVATAPVMSPPYVRVSPAIWGIDCRHGDEPGVLLVSLDVRIPWPQDHRDDDALRTWDDRCRTPCWDSPLHQLTEPGDDRRAALFSARLRVPIAELFLPATTYCGRIDLLAAKRALDVVANHVNAIAGPVVALLREHDSAGAER